LRTIYKNLSDKDSRSIIGVLSGTSADGVSIALVDVSGGGEQIQLELGGYEEYPYPKELRERVFHLFSPSKSNVDLLCRMNFALGEYFADCIKRFIEKNDSEGIDLIGSHGQTVWHCPRAGKISGYPAGSTLQIGEPAVIADRTGIPVVADFRKADIAAGGEGAPLTPYLDYAAFRSREKCRVLQNIGGIANLTYLPSDCDMEEVIAFDTGPGNMIIDYITSHYTVGEKSYDAGGKIAAEGEVNKELLDELLDHPYFNLDPPKSTGREVFGVDYSRKIIRYAEKEGISFKDTVATVTELTVESMANAYEELAGNVDEIYVSGGGAKNIHMIESLRNRVEPIPVYQHDALGIPSEAKEAVLFAVLANEHILGIPANICSVTGARRRVVLGSLFNPS